MIFAQGTGVAPFISILERIKNQNLQSCYKIIVMLGIRDDQESFIFKDFLTSFFQEQEMLGYKLFLACSRKVYEFGVGFLQTY